MKNLHIYYNNGQATEHIRVNDAQVQQVARTRMADTAIDLIDSLGYKLSRDANGALIESVWSDAPTHYVCEECGHSQAGAFATCPGCKTSDMIVKRSSGWQDTTVEGV